jgi:hypothetical protein
MISYSDGRWTQCHTLGKPVLMMSEITVSHRYRSSDFAGSSMFPRLVRDSPTVQKVVKSEIALQ